MQANCFRTSWSGQITSYSFATLSADIMPLICVSVLKGDFLFLKSLPFDRLKSLEGFDNWIDKQSSFNRRRPSLSGVFS